MSSSALRRTAATLVFAVLAAVSATPGCSQQGEGERCTEDQDCDSGLVCTDAATLLSGETDRCCPPAGGDIGDDRCNAKIGGVGGSGGTSSGAGAGGEAEPGGAGSSSGGSESSGGTENGGGAESNGGASGGVPASQGGAAGANAGAPTLGGAGAGQGGGD